MSQPDASAAYDRDRVGKRVALAALDDVRARMSDISTRLPSGDAYQLILDAKNNLALAQDLIKAELDA